MEEGTGILSLSLRMSALIGVIKSISLEVTYFLMESGTISRGQIEGPSAHLPGRA